MKTEHDTQARERGRQTTKLTRHIRWTRQKKNNRDQPDGRGKAATAVHKLDSSVDRQLRRQPRGVAFRKITAARAARAVYRIGDGRHQPVAGANDLRITRRFQKKTSFDQILHLTAEVCHSNLEKKIRKKKRSEDDNVHLGSFFLRHKNEAKKQKKKTCDNKKLCRGLCCCLRPCS